MALPMMLGSCLVSAVALYFTGKATKATTNAASSYSPLPGDPEERESLLCGRSVQAAVVDVVVEGNSSVGKGVWEAAKRKFRWAKANPTSRAERVMLVLEENAASSLLSGDREEMESPGSDNLSPSPESFEPGRPVEAAEVENPVDTMVIAKVTECNTPSPVAPDVVHAVEVDPMAVGNSLAAECNMQSTGAADVVNAALVDGDVEGNSCCNAHEVVAEAAKVGDLKVGDEGGATGSKAEVEPPGLWKDAKRKFMRAKAKVKSGAEWMMLDPDVVRRILKSGAEWVMPDPAVARRILKSMFLVVVDSVVYQAFKGNTVAFKLCAVLISELKRCM